MKEIKNIPVAYCLKCRKKQPIVLTDFSHKTKNIKVTSVHCAVCKVVLNMDKDVKVEYVDLPWMEKRGWKLLKKKKKTDDIRGGHCGHN
jgi:hypothetical protein